jgi:allantoicase
MTPETDLASRWLGGSVIAASDESFGEKENLLTPAPAAFEPGHYGNRGEIVDGWETKRRRSPGHDWAVIRLGAPGVITSIDVDTSFFTGNHPQSISIEACAREGYPGPAELANAAAFWHEIVPTSAIAGDSHNTFAVTDERRFTHVRLSAYPDGGIARLRVFGRVVPDPRGLEELTVDLASQQYGGVVAASSDDFYTSASNLNRPDRARTMGEGWETQRRRDGGHDHVVFRLAFPGEVRRIVVDTAHFKYNASAEVELYGWAGRLGDSGYPPGSGDPAGSGDAADWLPLLGRTRLQPDTRHEYVSQCAEPITAVRLDAFPDGGLSRVLLIGSIDTRARRGAGYLWANSLPADHAVECLTGAGISPDLAAEIERARPLARGWVSRMSERAASDDATAASCRAVASMIEGRPPAAADT